MSAVSENFDLQNYLIKGVERLVGEAVRATLKDPKESAFMLRFSAASKKASKKRRAAEDKGEHIPPFLIASITSKCNLHCEGCYSRCTDATNDCEPVRQLTAADWEGVFDEADGLGISFILLAGGEPMIRRDVLEAAGRHQNILFPVFTNGTFFDERYYELLDKRRNIIPVMSIEGDREHTDSRRGNGIYDKLMTNMDKLSERGLIFGASVTVTCENLQEVTSDRFLASLKKRGCKAVIYVEYVPVTEDSKELAPGDKEREYLKERISDLRSQSSDMVYVSFPGDEKSSGGCIAAGRGFFHINSHGGAEPCPFSPYSDINVKDHSLREALDSPLFKALQSGDVLSDDHDGGCVLYEKRSLVQSLIAANV
ncbi:MAG: radical SAM protein [Ruminococcus sp.]|nr:radical SAM protein [Ruminococcus sp.]